MTRTKLENEVADLRDRITSLEERARLDSVAEAFLRGDHAVREGDYFLLCDGRPTRLSSVSSGNGKWTYFDGRNMTEPFRVPDPTEYARLYTISEVSEILAKGTER